MNTFARLCQKILAELETPRSDYARRIQNNRQPTMDYLDYNLRVCRPHRLAPAGRDAVIRDIIGNLGRHYDNQNIIEPARMSIPLGLNPFKRKTIKACLGGAMNSRSSVQA